MEKAIIGATFALIIATYAFASHTTPHTGGAIEANNTQPTHQQTPEPTAEPTPTPAPEYNPEELELLARLINAEAGIMSDEAQLLVGNVVLNRMADSRFPNTMHDVIYQKGQYAPTWNGHIHKTPTDRAITNAKRILSGERFCDESVIWQAEFKQGKGVYKKISENIGGYTWTMYFCY